MQRINWGSAGSLLSRSYVCGHCGNSVASEKGWEARHANGYFSALIYICHQCTRPTLFDLTEGEKQTPGVVFGEIVKDIPDAGIEALYNEARACTGSGAFTAAVLSCRKLLMHLAVSLGATAGESFITYVQYLSDNHFVPPGAKGWVDHIRKKGNEANHEITLMSQADAEELLAFVQMLLKVIYEFPAAVQKKSAQ
jgi:DNA-directed RNA polymerase subunit RPC12/RpoP